MGPQRNIGVLTFHKCINYGSYWQARCLVEGLRAMGHHAELLDHDDRQVTVAELRCAFQPRLPERSDRGDLMAYGTKTRRFYDAFARLPLSHPFALQEPQALTGYDTVIVGSDEVWNLKHPWYGGKPIFYGAGLEGRRLVSYAASFGNHDAADGLDTWWADRLDNFDAISVRDDNSRCLVRGALGRDPALVLDPVLQFPEVARAKPDDCPPYLLIYGHGFPDWLRDAALAWRRRTGVPLLSIGYRNDWADEQRLDAGPAEFARAMAGAAGVLTNFFHGCIFALVNNKPLVAAPTPYRFNKVRDLAAKLGADRHIVSAATPAGAYERLLGEPPAPAVIGRIVALREQSKGFLRAALA